MYKNVPVVSTDEDLGRVKADSAHSSGSLGPTSDRRLALCQVKPEKFESSKPHNK